MIGQVSYLPDMPPTEITEPRLLRMPEAARLLSVSRATVYQMAKDGTLPGLVRIGRGSLRVNAAVLREWLDRKSEQVE